MHTILTSTRIRVVFVALMVALAAGLLAGCTPQEPGKESPVYVERQHYYGDI